MKKVLVAMSGGIDSSVAALLLKHAGFRVAGATMCLGIESGNSRKPKCCGREAVEDARRVCYELGIEHYVFDFSRYLKKLVIEDFVKEYLRGRTPNPCIECNKFLKFDILLKKAFILGFDCLATGHYAKIVKREGSYFLSKAKDRKKDQTYFLYPIRKKHLKNIIFPLADYRKKKVREIAANRKLPNAEKPQSQDICFIDKDYGVFLRERIKDLPKGYIVDRGGKVLGKHEGICFYTIGQRKGLGLNSSSPLYVSKIDYRENKVIAGPRDELRKKGLYAKNLNMLVEEIPRVSNAKIRYNQNEAECRIVKDGGGIKVIFKEVQEAITPGQSIVFYRNDIVLGGGKIYNTIN